MTLSDTLTCAVCGEDEPDIVLVCRDGVARCAHHAYEAGWCWWCGDAEPQTPDGQCFDCASMEVMWDRGKQRTPDATDTRGG